ncbi:MAG: 6-methylsalicylate decarboxylase [Thermoleophilaceae bacterium]|nr:6-methylsalicylate decarboxylase [Thermoleophilaceae bacterium]
MRSVDVHQHLWPEAVLRVLERRSVAPRVRWQGERWRVELPGEPEFEVDPRDHAVERRVAGLVVDRALVALSSPVGFEELPARDALAAVAAWQEAARELPDELGWWAATPVALAGDGEAELAREAIAEGAAGVCLPADRLATPDAAHDTLPLLAALAEAGAPVFIHPGPAHGTQQDPAWWSPATRYVAQQHAAWHSFHATIRPQLATLRAIFAGLAGLAPLQAERTANKGGPDAETALADPLVFYDTSSYGPRAVRAMATAVGIAQLVHGTDHPVHEQDVDPVEQAFGEGFAQLVKTSSPNRALGYTWVPAVRSA